MTAEFYLEHGKFDDGFASIEEDNAEGATVRGRVGDALLNGVGRMFRTNGLQLGYRYEDSPICIPDGTPAYPDNPQDYVPSSRPGARAPHVWLGNGRSLIDAFGHGFVMLRLGAGAPDVSAFEAAAAKQHVPLKTIFVDEPEAVKLYDRRLVLVRPDGHVAWRADALPPDAAAIIDHVRGASVDARH